MNYPNDLKPMIYAEPNENGIGVKSMPGEILYDGEHRGVRFKIINNRGYNPCCYIQVPEAFRYNSKTCSESSEDYYNSIFNVHGGITWYGNFEKYHDGEVDTIGWDYAHVGDYTPGIFVTCDYKWSSEELYDECICAIDTLLDEAFHV